MDKSKVQYPHGGSTTWDRTKFNDDTLEHEIELCRQNLYGVFLPEWNTGIKGLMNEQPYGSLTQEMLENAQKVWLERLKRAEDEKFERLVLS